MNTLVRKHCEPLAEAIAPQNPRDHDRPIARPGFIDTVHRLFTTPFSLLPPKSTVALVLFASYAEDSLNQLDPIAAVERDARLEHCFRSTEHLRVPPLCMRLAPFSSGLRLSSQPVPVRGYLFPGETQPQPNGRAATP
jgi:hypothetical protein